MKRTILILAGTFVLMAAAPSWLVWVGTGTDRNAAEVAAAGLVVVEELDEGCLVHASASDLPRLDEFGTTRLLDSDPEGKLHLHVHPRNGFPVARLEEFGTILLIDGAGVVLRTDDAGVEGLNRLPVELARIGLRPLVFGAREQGLPPLPAVDDSLVWALVNSVTQDSIEASIQRMQDFRTRYSTTDSCRAAMNWIKARLEYYGCDTVFNFTFRNGYAPNVIGIRYGLANPQRIYGICGHADATSDQQPSRSPGADDNASGTTAVLEAARVFQDVSFENTVYFMAFSGEEQGLYGSDSFASYCRRRGDSIQAVLNFDMISYGRQNIDTFEVIGKWSNPACEWLVDHFIAQADTFTNLKAKKSMTNYAPYSDHHSFWVNGYTAFCGIENDFTPEYHYTGDTIGPLYYRNCGTNNLPMTTDAIRAGVASLAKFAGAQLPTAIAEVVTPARPARLASVLPSVGPPPVRVRLTRPAGPGARLEVFESNGRRLQTLAVAGSSEATWDGRDALGRRVGAGSYLLRLSDGSRSTVLHAVLTD